MFLILVAQFLYSFRIVFVLFVLGVGVVVDILDILLFKVLQIAWKNVCLNPVVLLSISSLNADLCISEAAESY